MSVRITLKSVFKYFPVYPLVSTDIKDGPLSDQTFVNRIKNSA